MYKFITALLFIISCSNPNDIDIQEPTITNPYEWVESIHTELGVPFDSDTSNDYIIIRYQYALSYNKNTGTPNWVSWNLNKDWFGDVPRYKGNFITDTSLPADFYRVKHSDYTNSKYDRGHMVRSEERTKTPEDNKSTFLLTNIIPQRPDLNRGVWLKFEYFCEDLCKEEDKELYIVSGPIFHSDTTLKNEGKVRIPDSCFKIVVVLERGQCLEDVSLDTQIYSVIMPNINGVRKDKWEKYKRSIDDIENSTGYNFLDKIPDDIEMFLEQKN
jgi:endonuclease G